jgi:hypothetical protein
MTTAISQIHFETGGGGANRFHGPYRQHDKDGIGGGGECCGDSDAQLGRINVFYPEASGGKYMPYAVLFDLEPGVIEAVRASPPGEFFRPETS